ncbi:MAG TPA: hypothetical protein DDZ11_08715 [Lentisphaeria bacterium]|nr:hypothetical protein [Lentisphaeria bacterium]
MMQNRNSQSMMFGLGLDSADEHKRITKGENFVLVGGSEETHERMTETAIKVNEKLSARGKTLDTVGREEFFDIVSECSE